jgi:hypothetical protein
MGGSYRFLKKKSKAANQDQRLISPFIGDMTALPALSCFETHLTLKIGSFDSNGTLGYYRFRKYNRGSIWYPSILGPE